MNCNCGGAMTERKYRGEPYMRCNACGRCELPERLRRAAKVAVWIRGHYANDIGGKQQIAIRSNLFDFEITEYVMQDAIMILRDTMGMDVTSDGVRVLQ